MATSYTSLLGLALPVTGELSGTWGDTVNNYITSYVDAAVAGAQTLSTDADATLTKTTGTSLGSTSSQYAILNNTGARTALRTITVPAASKAYLVINATTGGYGVKVVGAGPTTGVTIANGKAALIAWNGSDFITIASNDASVITGILAVANGGTGKSSWTSNGVVYASGTTTLANGTALTFDGTTLNFGSTAQRITGDFINATIANRVMFQSSTTNGNTSVGAIPNGIGGNANFSAYADSNPVNSSRAQLAVNGPTDVRVSSDIIGTGTYLPMTFYTGGSERVRIDTSGNVGIGTASPTGGGGGTILNVYGTSAASFRVNNATDATDLFTAGGIGYLQTATNIPLVFRTNATERMRIDSSGNVGIGTASPGALLDVGGNFQVSSTGALTSANLANAVGYKGTPLNEQSTAYTLVIGDMGKSIVHPASDNNARTFTIPANGTVAFPVGTTITFINMINTVTIAITTDTMYLAGTGTTGSRTLAAYGMATAVKMTSTTWIISGNGLT